MERTGKKLTEEERLAKEPVGKLLWRLSLHSGASLLLYSLFTLTDTVFIARGVNETAAGAVSVASPLLLLLNAVSTTLGAGGASVISRALGRKDRETAAVTAVNVFLLFWCTALAVSAAGLLFLEPLLQGMGAVGELLPYAKVYSGILLAGAVTATGFSSLIRAEGAVRFSLYLWAGPVTVNLVLDGVFIFLCKMGVAGAALGTVISQAVSLAMSMWFFFLRKKRSYVIRLRHFRIRAKIAAEVAGVGLSSLLQLSSTALLLILVNRMLAAQGGSTAVTAFGFAQKLQNLFFLPQSGIVQAMQPVIGYNLAGKEKGRAMQAVRTGLRGGCIFGLAVMAGLLVFRQPLLGIFTGQVELLRLGGGMLAWLAPAFPIKGMLPSVAAYYQSAGRKKSAVGLTLTGFLALQLPLLLLLGRAGGVGGTVASLTATDAAGGLLAPLLWKREEKNNG